MVRQGADRGPLKERAHDLYETPPEATRALIRTGCLDQFEHIFEPCAGRGAIVRELIAAGGWRVLAHDLIAYEGADEGIHTPVDFFQARGLVAIDAIVTNPPFRQADDFVRKGLSLGVPVIVLLRLMSLEGANRSDILQHLRHVFIGIERLPKFQRDNWKGRRLKTETAPFGWFVFSPQKRLSDTFTVSRISWREEAKIGFGEARQGHEIFPASNEEAKISAIKDSNYAENPGSCG
jgi:hypothetical protein